MHRLLGSDTLYRASTSISILNNVAPEDQVVNLDAREACMLCMAYELQERGLRSQD